MIIGRLTGDVAALGLDHVLIDVNGVGYVALAGTRLLARLQAGDRVTVQIETRVTESSITLFAFATDEERAWFVRLQDVPGVAGKSALAILDGLAPSEIMDAIALGDSGAFTRAKGIGKKLGERIVTELAGKAPPMGRFGKFETAAIAGLASQPVAASTGPRAEAISALTNLGYTPSEASRAVAAAAKEGAADTVNALVKGALKELAR
ncbi:MAG: Holliday junction branch migration protein RuvA [Hyphomonas sp.]|uniref:Holliday junction branch migration protein RuvA n=1 Tax=Hyphomonas sp. TaxID=87 RepID=UPI00180956D1|nr:Holliday junction branch migration protein RuvA [Hyphomonas sp.]MBU3922227.1 Holliday junction branch migration protein RuvA [Alphaproteobacteria bacterium]MBA3069030.1 Holliday junction branch migration protein RuvA [Hyphomonas sp.]MBU4061663.1 Holliday junction branch migration protein RuvA [Alphaproteobacteria bacterium]MBU4163508.1 Holliday junction branch migration protein RuvA [Alphaproteobacteria bacterium]MBU4567668.1 Holliday junction branch migration protein RuvA [Alphaproteobacte